MKSNPTDEKHRKRSLIGRSFTWKGNEARKLLVDGCRPKNERTPVSQNPGPVQIQKL